MATEAAPRHAPQSPFSTPSHSESDDASSSDSRHIGSSKKVITASRQESRKRGNRREKDSDEEENGKSDASSPPAKRKKEDDSLQTRTGGAYIPPARLRMMQQQIADKSSEAYQRLSWEALKKSIHGLINKVNVANISMIVREILLENIIRGRGLIARSVIQAQSFSPSFTNVYAALVAIMNTKFPNIGELIIHRLLANFKKGYRRNDKGLCLSALQFVAHLVNQNVLHEVAALEIFAVLLEDANDNTVEVAVGFLKECGAKLTEVAGRAVMGVFDTLRQALHEGKLETRTQYMIEVLQAVRKDKFKEYPTVADGLDLVEEEDQCTHMVGMDDELDPQDRLDVFRFDPDFVANEEKYRQLRAEILGESSSSEGGSSGEESESEESEDEQRRMEIQDETQMNVMALRRTIYLTIMSSLDYEECAHKLLKMKMKEGQQYELCSMIIECCSQERSFKKFFGLLGQRFCMLNKVYVEQYDRLFQEHYATVHRLDTVKIRNVAKFFAHLLYSDAIPWTTLACIRLNEDETNSSSRIYIKILFQELAEYMGLEKMNQRLNDPFLQPAFEGLMPRDNPRDTRFSINFFTSVGLGGLTDGLREHLKNAPKMIMQQTQDVESSDSSSSDSDDSSSGSESESSEEEHDDKKKRKWPVPPTSRGSDSRRKSPERSRHRARKAETPEELPERRRRRDERRPDSPEEPPHRFRHRDRKREEAQDESSHRSHHRERRRVDSPQESPERMPHKDRRRVKSPGELPDRSQHRDRRPETPEDPPSTLQQRDRRRGGSPESPDRLRRRDRKRAESPDKAPDRSQRRDKKRPGSTEESSDRLRHRDRRRAESPEGSLDRSQRRDKKRPGSTESPDRLRHRDRKRAESPEESPHRIGRRDRKRIDSPVESHGRSQRRDRRRAESPEESSDILRHRDGRRAGSPEESPDRALHRDSRLKPHARAETPEGSPDRSQRRGGRRKDSPVGRKTYSKRSGSRDASGRQIAPVKQPKSKEGWRDVEQGREGVDSSSDMDDGREAMSQRQQVRGGGGRRDDRREKDDSDRDRERGYRGSDTRERDGRDDRKRDRYFHSDEDRYRRDGDRRRDRRDDDRRRDRHGDDKGERDYHGSRRQQMDDDRREKDYRDERGSRRDLSSQDESHEEQHGKDRERKQVDRHLPRRPPVRDSRRRPRRVTSSSSSEDSDSSDAEKEVEMKTEKRDDRRDRDYHRRRRERRKYSSEEER